MASRVAAFFPTSFNFLVRNIVLFLKMFLDVAKMKKKGPSQHYFTHRAVHQKQNFYMLANMTYLESEDCLCP